MKDMQNTKLKIMFKENEGKVANWRVQEEKH
jgi:hypothetical protein